MEKNSMDEKKVNTFGIEILGYRSRHNKLIDFIDKNQGCTNEFIVNNCVSISRNTIFKIINDLVQEGIVERKKSDNNKKEIKNFIVKNHPMLILRSDIEKFRKYFTPMFEQAISRGFKWEFEERPRQALSLIAASLEAYFLFIQIVNYRVLLEWPNKIKDQETLRRLYYLLYSEMTDIQIEMSDKLRNKATEIREKWHINDVEDDISEGLLGVTEANFLPDEYTFHKIESEFKKFKSATIATPLLSHLSKMRFNIPTTIVYPSEEEYKTQRSAADELVRRLNPPGFNEKLKKHTSYSKMHRYTEKGRITQLVPYINLDAFDKKKKNVKKRRK
jgi:predicted transcriptional regulator